MRYGLSLCGAVVMIGVVYVTFLQSETGPLGFEGQELPDWVAVAGLAMVMILGIFFGSLFRRMGSVDRQVDIVAEIRELTRSSSFIASLCVSPIVFFLAFLSVRGSPGDPASFLLAFQNGFFCEAIFRRMFRDDGTPLPEPHREQPLH